MGGVYAIASALLVVAVLAVAYGTAAPAVGVAEFAPAAQKNLAAPPTTGDDAANSSGAARRRATTTSTPAAAATPDSGSDPAAAPTTRTARTRVCVGNPPRQTEDPMSPPCLATIFEGDNGGATATGVSATEIRVAVPTSTGFLNGSNQPSQDAARALFDYFNRHFEFYGRRLVPVFVEGSTADAISSRSLGADIASRGVFAAATGYLEDKESDPFRPPQAGLVQEMARSKVVVMTRNTGLGWSDRTLFDAFHPYVWSVFPSAETNLANIADLTCTALVDRVAAHALDPALTTQTRRIGVLSMGKLTPPPVGALVDKITDCNERPVIVEATYGTPSVQTALQQLKAAGVTTVICACEFSFAWNPAISTARSLSFHPEWVILTSPIFSDELLGQIDSYRAGFIRLESGPKLLPLQTRPWFTAFLETNPGLLTTSKATLQNAFTVGQDLYDGLLALASGIQGAGPALTPDTFAAALMSTQFPNPGAGGPPYWQPSAGFGPGDHAFFDDYAVSWWSDTTPALEPYSFNAQGSWCYLGAGARFSVGRYPGDADRRLYNPAEPCR